MCLLTTDHGLLALQWLPVSENTQNRKLSSIYLVTCSKRIWHTNADFRPFY